MNTTEYGIALYETIKQNIKEKLRSQPGQYKEMVEKVVKDIREKGFVVFEDYYTEEKCDSVKNDIEALCEKYKDQMWVDEHLSDKRLYGADRKSPLIAEFFQDDFITEVRNCYYKSTDLTGFTLGAMLDAAENNLGSGGGWHRDSIFATQLKAIIYLNDVTEDTGPFQYVTHTHSQSSKLNAVQKLGVKAKQNRLDDEIVNKVLELDDHDLVTFTAKKGTLLIIDTTGIHRGKPIKKGTRYALTNYYFVHEIPHHINDLVLK